MSVTSAPPRRRAAAALTGLAFAVAGLVACDTTEPPTTGTTTGPGTSTPTPTPVVADIDTFSNSGQPDATRGNDVVMRVMDSAGKLKIGYISFPVTATTPTTSARLALTPKHSGFSIDVHNSNSFTNHTTHNTRPSLGTKVGTLTSTRAGATQTVDLSGVTVARGRVYLAITTSSAYELEITSAEGAPAAKSGASTSTAPTLITTAPGPVTTTPPPTTQPPVNGWRLTFADEFDGTRVDTSKWNIYDEAGPWSGVESPKATTCPKASNVSVGGGILTMQTKKANGACSGGQPHTGAGLNSWGKFEQAQGRFEARVRWTHKGNYLWGGFWTHGNGGPGWKKSMGSEIDVFEYIGKNAEPNLNRFKPAIHFNYDCNPKCMQNVNQMQHDVTKWQTYSVEWEPTNPSDPTSTQIRFYLDGRQIAQFDKGGAWQVTPSGSKVQVVQGAWTNDHGPFPTPFGPDRAHKLILSAWVGAPNTSAATAAAGYNPSGGHADLQVDWVRVYSR